MNNKMSDSEPRGDKGSDDEEEKEEDVEMSDAEHDDNGAGGGDADPSAWDENDEAYAGDDGPKRVKKIRQAGEKEPIVLVPQKPNS